MYSIYRINYVFSDEYETRPIKNCQSIKSSCSSSAYNLGEAISSHAWYLNGGENAYIQVLDDKNATLGVYNEQKKWVKYPLQIKLNQKTQTQPKHIIFTATSNEAKTMLAEKFGAVDYKIAWYEYDNKAVMGSYEEPKKGYKSKYYSYNKTAINDILTQWIPAKNPVLE